MGILDSLENSPAFRGALGQLEAAIVPVVLSEVFGRDGQGGLSAIVAKLEQAGLRDHVKPPPGNGHNHPLPAQPVLQMVSSEKGKGVAARFPTPIDPP